MQWPDAIFVRRVGIPSVVQNPTGPLVVFFVVNAAEDMQRRAARLVGPVNINPLIPDTVPVL